MSDEASGVVGVGLNALLGRMRLLEQDHEPDGWPAVQMRDLSALCEALEASEVKLEAMRDAVRRVNFRRVTNMEMNELRMENDRLRGACKSAIEWLEGWASAEPYLKILRDAVTTPNA